MTKINELYNSNDYNYLFKVVLIGDSHVGKSTFLIKYATDEFLSDCFPTIGVDFRVVTKLTAENKVVKLQIWDTAGQEKYRNLISSYYRGVHGVLILFDICDEESFNNLEFWIDDIKTHHGQKSVIYIIGNKIDLVSKRVISLDDAKKFCKERDYKYFEVSSKDNTIFPINEIFEELMEDLILTFPERYIVNNKIENTISLSKEQSRKCC